MVAFQRKDWKLENMNERGDQAGLRSINLYKFASLGELRAFRVLIMDILRSRGHREDDESLLM
jgi:hypothetical protein